MKRLQRGALELLNIGKGFLFLLNIFKGYLIYCLITFIKILRLLRNFYEIILS